MSFTKIGTMEMSCPVCGAQTKHLFFKHGYAIHECMACQHRSVAQHLSDHSAPCDCQKPISLISGSDSNFTPDGLANAEVLQSYGRRYAEILKAYMPPGTVLDVGADAGFILKGVLERGWHGVGLEANHRLVTYGRAHLGLPMVTGSLENTAVHPIKRAHFDLVMMIQAIEHFHDLHQALHNAALLTRPNGFWLIETWDRTSWPAQLFGRYWHEYNPPDTLHWFSPAGLIQLADQYGFVEVARGRPQKWYSGAHMKLQIQSKLHSFPGHQVLEAPLGIIPDQLKIPQPNFALFWMLLQKRAKPRLYSVSTIDVPANQQQENAAVFN